MNRDEQEDQKASWCRFYSLRNFTKAKSAQTMSLKFKFNFALLGLAILCWPAQTFAQKLAILAPVKTDLTEKFAGVLHDSLSSKLVILDNSLSGTAFQSVVVENVFNMTARDAKRIAAIIGCDYFLIVQTGSLRRSSFEKAEYYEAYYVLYLVSGRTGRLSLWDLRSFEANSTGEAEKLLIKSSDDLSIIVAEKMTAAFKIEIAEEPVSLIEEVPVESSTKDKTFQPPMPFKRIKPDYTRTAYLYDAKGTVDISVDIDQNGAVKRTEIIRWAGYGLDESVVEAVRKMNWRPAERGGKPLPMRVLLRYNFTKIDKE